MKGKLKIVIGLCLTTLSNIVLATSELDQFLKAQPVIDVHINITKGYPDNKDYDQEDPNIDLAKIKWIGKRFDQNNIVLALGGGPMKYAKLMNVNIMPRALS